MALTLSYHVADSSAEALGATTSNRADSSLIAPGRHKRSGVFAERFWSNVRKTNGCWVWTASAGDGGYGHISIGDVIYRCHRVSWEIANGPVPHGMCVCHTCDNPICVNPSHLFLGTHLDNLRDAAQKGRIAKGEKNGHATLTEGKVRMIRAMAESKMYLQSELAEIFIVTQSCISSIVNFNTWRHVTALHRLADEQATT